MDKNSTFGQLFEQGKVAVDDSSKNVLSTTKNQVVGNTQSTQNQPNIQSQEIQTQLSEESREIIKDFYEPSQPVDTTTENEGKEQRLARVRSEIQKLQVDMHQANYVEPLFSYEQKYKQQQQQQQEVQDEQEEQQNKMAELQTAQRKREDLTKFRAQRNVEIKGQVAG
jgi:hypothetical protein